MLERALLASFLAAARAASTGPVAGIAPSTTTFESLARAARMELSVETRLSAAEGAAAYDGPRAVDLAQDFLRNEQGEGARASFCLFIATVPAHKDDGALTTVLVWALGEDPAASVRAAAAKALQNRGDRRAVPDLERSAKSDADPLVRKAAEEARRILSIPPKVEKRKAAKVENAYEAVKGRDRCPRGNGWCECSNGALTPRPRCLPRDDCEHLFETAYRHQGYRCTWDGQAFEE